MSQRHILNAAIRPACKYGTPIIDRHRLSVAPIIQIALNPRIRMLGNTLARVESDCKQYSAVIAVVLRSFRTANAEASAARKYGNVTEPCYLSPTINCVPAKNGKLNFRLMPGSKKKKKEKKRKKRDRDRLAKKKEVIGRERERERERENKRSGEGTYHRCASCAAN